MARLNLFSAPPETPIEHLATQFRNYLHMPSPDMLYVLMGSVAANMVEGYPVWLMFVGAPSAGGTVFLDTLLGLPGVFEAGSIDSTAAFLSGTGKKDKAKDATGGLLRLVGTHGAIITKDFTSILSLPPDTIKKILSVFRECYDGRWTRPTGTDGGKSMSWEGRLALFGKVTSEIDRHHTVASSLGERWVYYRLESGDGFAKARQALINSSRTGWQQELRDIVAGFFEGLDIAFGKSTPRRDLTDGEIVRVIRIAGVAARCRSAIVRDLYRNDIIAVPEQELEARLSTALGQLLVGMDLVGVPEEDRWRLLQKVAMDSMPRIRRLIIEEAKREGGVLMTDLQKSVRCSTGVVKRAVEDLENYDIVRKYYPSEGKCMVELTQWMRENWREAE